MLNYLSKQVSVMNYELKVLQKYRVGVILSISRRWMWWDCLVPPLKWQIWLIHSCDAHRICTSFNLLQPKTVNSSLCTLKGRDWESLCHASYKFDCQQPWRCAYISSLMTVDGIVSLMLFSVKKNSMNGKILLKLLKISKKLISSEIQLNAHQLIPQFYCNSL